VSADAGDRWLRYYEATAGRPPRDTLLRALAAIEAEGAANSGRLALDLGSGDGRDTVELLRRGWHVIAVDAEPRAFERLRGRPDLIRGEALETRVERIEDAALPAADLVNASFALPFCPPDRFAAMWRRIVAALKPGGRFAGQLLGMRDDWAKDPKVTSFEPAAARALLKGLALEHFEEEEVDSATATGVPKHWHLFHVVARKP
jgi:SAM-dependent methyltransferase